MGNLKNKYISTIKDCHSKGLTIPETIKELICTYDIKFIYAQNLVYNSGLENWNKAKYPKGVKRPKKINYALIEKFKNEPEKIISSGSTDDNFDF